MELSNKINIHEVWSTHHATPDLVSGCMMRDVLVIVRVALIVHIDKMMTPCKSNQLGV